MNWMVFVVPLSTLLVLVVISLAALSKLPADARLPMQWGVRGKPTWFASRGVALGFTPALACTVFAIMLTPGVVDGEAILKPALSASLNFVAGVFVVVHLVHIWFAIRHVKRQSSGRV
ncbi:MAG: hypothetical protein ABL996_12105 [Micropepsaceae bacterium]